MGAQTTSTLELQKLAKTAKKLAALEITTVRELAYADAETLTAAFGPRTGLWLLLLAKGGGGLLADPAKARTWLQQAAAQNDADAKRLWDVSAKISGVGY